MAIATGITIAKSLLNPDVQASRIATYSFPQTVALDSWKLVTSKDTVETIDLVGDIVATRKYEYQQPKQNLVIRVRYLTNTDGDIKSIVDKRIGNLTTALRNNPSGDYALYTYQGKAYLNACLNPNGESTVTSDAFNRNHTIYSRNWRRITPWFLGKRDLKDKRCLWMQLLIDLPPETPIEETYRTLELVWSDWLKYWQPNFPDE